MIVAYKSHGFQQIGIYEGLDDGAVHTRLQEVLVRRAGKWWLASLQNVIIDTAYMPMRSHRFRRVRRS